MDFVSKLLQDSDLKYEDLNYVEKEYLKNLNLGQEAYTLVDFKTDLARLRDSLALELCNTPTEEAEKNVMLKARLLNYMLLLAKLSAPEEAQKAIERALANKKESKIA